mgnify:CR=1 FL=1
MQQFLQAVRHYAEVNQKTSSRARFIVESLSDKEILEFISDAVSEEDAIECVLEEAECCMEYQGSTPGSWTGRDGHHCNEDL